MTDPFVRTSVCSVFVNLLAKTTGEPCSPFLMSAVHGLYARWHKIFERDGNTRDFHRFRTRCRRSSL